MRVKKYLALTLAAALATCLLTACPWDIEDDAASSPSSAPSSSSRPSHDSSDDDSSSAPSSPSTPDEPKITVDDTGALQLPADKKTLSATDIEGIKGKIKTVNLTNIDVSPNTFAGCPELTTVTIKNGTLDSSDAVSINGPFNNCEKLETVTLDGVTINGDYTFWNCEKLETVTLDGVTISGFGTFTWCENLHTVNLENNVNVKNATHTFDLCRKLTTVNGANTLETIPQSMFINCSSLRYIDISEATSIGHSAFAGCTSLTAVDVNNATSIGQSAFLGCNSLKNIRVGAGLQEIGVSAFKMIDLHGNTIPMELTVHCRDSKEEITNLESIFKNSIVGSYAEDYPKFEYNCDNDCWSKIVNESQTGSQDAGNALARYLLDLRL